MEADTPDLPSTVEETLAACPKFRIVLIGNTGVGKSSLVSNVFNISFKDIDIEHDRPGDADITRGYTSAENPRLILHDSKGFEWGSTANWHIVENFLRERSAMQMQDRVHAIWLCITTPREGSRLLQTGEEKLLRLARELKIPIIVVCTKYDLLINELFVKAQEDDVDLTETELETRAEACFRDRVRRYKKLKKALIVKVSTDKDYPQRIETLQELANVTCNCLRVDTAPGQAVESVQGLALVPWIVTQRINAAQKVELSIREGFKKYWRNLGKSVFFQGQTLHRCVWRIHDDIVKVWNLNDPEKLLSNGPFFAQVIKLVEPTLSESEGQIPQDDFLTIGGEALAVARTVVAPSAHFLVAVQIGTLALKFLYGRYKQIPLTAQYLGTYIVDLTCVLHRLFMKTLLMEQPMALSNELISDVVESYNRTDAYRVHHLVREMNFLLRFEDQIAQLLREYTNLPQTTNASVGEQQPRGPDSPSTRMALDPDAPESQPSLVDRQGTLRSLPTGISMPNHAAPDSRHSRHGRFDEAKYCIVM